MKRYLIIFITILFLCGCFETSVSEKQSSLPVGASEITILGNGWVTFRLNGNLFLYHKQSVGYSGYESITQITEK